jgi:tetratricopeptide (TPR) repeat protein
LIVSRSEATVEELLQLLPPMEELEVLRLRLIGSAVRDPAKAWDSSSAYATVDKRILGVGEVQSAVRAAEESLRDYVTFLHEGLHPVFLSFFDGRTEEAVRHLIALGERQEGAGRVKSARQCYQTALSLSLPLPSKTEQMLALRRIARVALSLGELPDATSHYLRAVELAVDSGDPRGTAIARTGIGNVQMFQGRWTEAEESYAAALELIEPLDDDAVDLERGQLYNNLGNVTTRLDRHAEADAWLARAQELWARVDSPLDLAVCCVNLGQLRQEERRYAEAHQVLARAMELPISSGLRSLIATDLAVLCLRERRVSEAEEWGRVAEEHAIAASSPYNLGRMYHIRGNVATARGEEDGFTFFEKALEIAREKGYLFLEAEALLDYACLRCQTGGAEEAEAYLERAAELFGRLGSPRNADRAQAALARMRGDASHSRPPLAAAGD